MLRTCVFSYVLSLVNIWYQYIYNIIYIYDFGKHKLYIEGKESLSI